MSKAVFDCPVTSANTAEIVDACGDSLVVADLSHVGLTIHSEGVRLRELKGRVFSMKRRWCGSSRGNRLWY